MSLFTLKFLEFLTSLAVKEPFVNIFPLFNTFSTTFIFPNVSISPELLRLLFIFKFFPVTTFPLFSNLFTVILSFTLSTFSFFKSLDVKRPLVNIFPLFRVFSFIKILSNV